MGIERSQDDEFIHASDEKFDGHKCISDENLSKIIRRLQECNNE